MSSPEIYSGINNAVGHYKAPQTKTSSAITSAKRYALWLAAVKNFPHRLPNFRGSAVSRRASSRDLIDHPNRVVPVARFYLSLTGLETEGYPPAGHI